MSQHMHPQQPQPQYVHYPGPSNPPHPYIATPGVGIVHPQSAMSVQQQTMHIMHYQQPMVQQGIPQQPVQQQQQVMQASGSGSASQAIVTTATASTAGNASGSSSNGPLVTTGDWTKDLVQLAKQAELKKHALTLQLHTAHILSAHATLEAKSKAIQDVKEQKNKLDSERARLLKCLQEVNADRDKADLAEGTMQRECEELRSKITQLSEGEYAIAKADVDRLRSELGQPPLPSLQQTLEERTAQYLTERRLNGNDPDSSHAPSASANFASSSSFNTAKRSAPNDSSLPESQMKRPRGRPKGSKNKKNVSS